MAGDLRERLRARIREVCYREAEEPIFRLRSGRMSRYYVDLKALALNPEDLWDLSGLLLAALREHGLPDGVGGRTLGADPLAYGVALRSLREPPVLRPFVVRKEPKAHGTQKWVEGQLPEGSRVVILEDVATTGGSAWEASKRVKEIGWRVLYVLAVVDREEGARQFLEEKGLPFYALFRLSEIRCSS